jgi:hypothetical protein
MTLLPDDDPALSTLRGELENKRPSVHLEVGRYTCAEASPKKRASALLEELGFTPPPEWKALSGEEAVAYVARLLAREPLHENGRLPPAEAALFAARIRALFSEHAVFLTIGDPPRESAPSLSSGSLDLGVLVIDGDRAGLLWGEQEL